MVVIFVCACNPEDIAEEEEEEEEEYCPLDNCCDCCCWKSWKWSVVGLEVEGKEWCRVECACWC